MYVRMTFFEKKEGKTDMVNFESCSVGVPTQKSHEVASSSKPLILRTF